MRKLILPALIASVFAFPAFAQVNVGGAVGGAAATANTMQLGAPGAQTTLGGSMQAGANMTAPVGNTVSSTAQNATDAATSSAQRAEATAARTATSAKTKSERTAAAARGAAMQSANSAARTQAQGVISSDVKDDASGTGQAGFNAQTAVNGDASVNGSNASVGASANTSANTNANSGARKSRRPAASTSDGGNTQQQ